MTRVKQIMSERDQDTLLSSSRISGFYKMELTERLAELERRGLIDRDDIAYLSERRGGLPLPVADKMVENLIGVLELPLGLGLNFKINDKDYVVPMAIEEPSVVAAVSHLPQLAAVALVRLAAEVGDDALALAAGGFRDMTRIASSPFGMWGDILGANRDAVLAMLETYTDGLGALHDAVRSGDLSALEVAFERSAATRSAIPSHAKGFLTPLAEVTLWAEDRVGFLAAVTGALAEARLNIKDMELLRVRENEGGAFRLAFADGPAADAAIRVLRNLGLRAERR